MRRLSIIAALGAALAASPAGAVDRAYDPATEVSCDRLLVAAVDLTKEAYLHDGATPAQAETEALLMLPDRFFFWPGDYFLLYPHTGDAEFMRLRAAMTAIWARSDLLGCGIAFHPIPES